MPMKQLCVKSDSHEKQNMSKSKIKRNVQQIIQTNFVVYDLANAQSIRRFLCSNKFATMTNR